MRILISNDDGIHASGLGVPERIGRQENDQEADGGVRVPAALKPDMGGRERIAR